MLQEVLIFGHSTDVWSIAWHPANPAVCATVCDGNRVFLWDTAQWDLLRTAQVGMTARAVAISTQPYGASGYHVAVGGVKGHIKVGPGCTAQVPHQHALYVLQ